MLLYNDSLVYSTCRENYRRNMSVLIQKNKLETVRKITVEAKANEAVQLINS